VVVAVEEELVAVELAELVVEELVADKLTVLTVLQIQAVEVVVRMEAHLLVEMVGMVVLVL
jgi:hypothetical protein